MARNWICVTNPINFEIVIGEGVWGVEDDGRLIGIEEKGPTRETFSRYVETGDHLLFYTKKNKLFRGVYKVASSAYRDHTPKWPDRTYPNRVKILKVDLGKATHAILFTRPELIRGLSFVKHPSRWYSYLQCSMRLISRADYELALSLITSISR